MKNKTIKKALALGMSVLMLASTFTPTTAQAAGWKQNKSGWWWEEDNGSYPTNSWKQIGGTWYYFDGNGYMAIGWVQVGNTWYYMNESGAMQADTCIGDNYVDGSGAWIPGKTKTQTGWIQSGNRWWYRHADGSYTRNGWETIGGRDYYFDSDGWMLTGWKNLNGQWYYLESSGEKATNKWIGNYYVESNGVMATNKWIGNYYVNGSGLWVETKCQHNYDGGVVTTAATCGKEGIKTFTCKTCGDSYTETLPMLTHNWVHHEAEGHYETVIIKEATKEPIWEYITICNDCGKQFTGPNQADDCGLHTLECDGPTGSYHTEDNLIGYKDIPAVAEDRWVVDTLAYDACSVCGFKK